VPGGNFRAGAGVFGEARPVRANFKDKQKALTIGTAN